MKLTKENKRILADTKEKLKNLLTSWKEGDTSSFDNCLKALKSMEVVAQQTSQVTSPYQDRGLKHMALVNQAGFNLFKIRHSTNKANQCGEKIVQSNALIYDSKTVNFAKNIFEDTVIASISVMPTVQASRPLQSPTFFDQAALQVNGIKYSILFSDNTSVDFYSLEDPGQLAKARDAFDEKMHELTSNNNNAPM